MVVVVVPYLWCIALSCLQASVTPKGSRMRIRGLICIAVGLMLTAAAARAEEVTIVSGVLGPEGPLFVTPPTSQSPSRESATISLSCLRLLSNDPTYEPSRKRTKCLQF
jgi:hypothetical protein